MRRYLARSLLGLAITLFFVGHALHLYRIGFIDQLDNIIYDARLRLTMPRKGDPRIVILDIDEKSLGQIGRWPWSRNVMALLTDKLFDKYHVQLLGFDVIWAERDVSSGIDVFDDFAKGELKSNDGYQTTYRRRRPGLDYDALFAASLKGRPVVLGYYFSGERGAVKANAIPPPVLPAGTFPAKSVRFARWHGYTGNLPAFAANAASAGHFNPLVDDDGVVRRVPMLLEFEGAYYEPLSIAMVRTLLALETGTKPDVEPVFSESAGSYSGVEWLKVGPYAIPVDEEAAALVPYQGPKGTLRYVSLSDVLAERVPPERLEGKIALLGTTAPGLQDLRSTPVGSVYPGVEVHANMISSILSGNTKQKPAYTRGAEVILVLLGGVVLSLLIPALPAGWSTVATLAGFGMITGFNFMLWSEADIVLPLAASVLMTAFLYTMNMSYGYFFESRSKRQFKELFGQYVPPELVDRMAADPRKYSMEPRAAELTILFSDVRGFTSISEALKPGELREYINEYLTDMSGIIRSKYNGTLDKYIGDAIMAFWGAPIDDPQHARNGVLAAMVMQRECAVLNERFTARNWPPLKIGVGLNTGSVRVGDMGSKVRRAYTVMGDPVNVASRLEARTKYYGVGILVGEATRYAVKDVLFREIDRIKVKGKEEALTIYEPLGFESDVSDAARQELKLWDLALQAYRAGDWDVADTTLNRLLAPSPERVLYRLYSERVAAFRAAPPPANWNGITAFEEK